MQLAVGRYYHRRLADTYPVQIVHQIDPATFEYKHGLRFVDEGGQSYLDDGQAIFGLRSEKDNVVTLQINKYDRLIAEIPKSDLDLGYSKRFYVSPDEAEKSESYIHYTDPRFFIGLGNVYIMRSGIPVHIDSVIVNRDETQVFKTGNNHYSNKGFYYSPNSPSIYDLVYMRRNYEPPRSEFIKKILGSGGSDNGHA